MSTNSTAVRTGLAAALPATDGALAHWSLDGVITNAGSIGSVGDMTLQAGTIRYEQGPAPNTQAFFFDGATRLRTAGNPSALKVLGDQTIDALIKPHGYNTFNAIIYTYRDEGVYGIQQFALTNPAGSSRNRLRWVWSIDGTSSFSEVVHANVNAAPHRWCHVTAVRNSAGTGKIYINGRRMVTVAGNPQFNWTPNTPFANLGCGPFSDFFHGCISSVRVFSGQRSDAQILADAKAAVPAAFLGEE